MHVSVSLQQYARKGRGGRAQVPVTIWGVLQGRLLSAAEARLRVPVLPAVRLLENVFL